jgi:hydroxymethylpyrimidine/phosphomethylpyrimidine kinase
MMPAPDGAVSAVRAALTIAGSDSGGGAGIQADLKTFAAHGVYGTSAITAITAQNTVGVTAVSALAADLVTAQIEAVASDIPIQATKIGMLANAAIVEAVAAAIRDLDLPRVVLDPVMLAKSGDLLLDEEAVEGLRVALLPCALVVTPNLPEAAVLCGHAVESPHQVREAARRIHDLGAKAVVVKGGHGRGDRIVDLLFDGDRFVEFPTTRIQTRNTHGTGCTFASAVAARLALGHDLADAVARAQVYVVGAIRHGLAIGQGHGPLDHFWQTRAAGRPEATQSVY